MKAVIMSDSHKNFNSILRIMDQEQDADLLIHAGDVQRDVDDILDTWPKLPCEYVLGNNDYAVAGVPDRRLFAFAGKRIFLTHGHLYGVRQSASRLAKKAKEMEADICVFGHTHVPYLKQIDGVWMVNPGSTWQGYATIQVMDGVAEIELKDN